MLSTVEQFKNNCPALSMANSGITEDDILTIINMADSVVNIDLANYYATIYIKSNVKYFNLLSQYKSAEVGLKKMYGFSTRNPDTEDIKWWNELYDSLLRKLIHGMVIYDAEGNKIPGTNNIAISEQEVTEIRTYADENETYATIKKEF